MSFADQSFSTATATSLATPDRRRSSRCRFRGEIRVFWAGPEFTGNIRDVTASGIAFCVDRSGHGRRLRVGNRLRLLFTPPECDDCAAVNIVGDVVRIVSDTNDTFLVAVVFQHL